MAFPWYAMLLMGPVWNILNSFAELQRSLAAMERVFDMLAMPPAKMGTHDELMTARGAYHGMVLRQAHARREEAPAWS